MITATSLENKYQTRVSDGTHELLTDPSVAHGGQNAGFGPVSLLEAALAACVNTVVRIAADKRGIPLAGVTVEVNLNMENKAEYVFAYRIDLKGDLTDEQKTTLLRAAEGCPAKKILGGQVTFQALS